MRFEAIMLVSKIKGLSTPEKHHPRHISRDETQVLKIEM